MLAIEIENLSKQYKDVLAVDSLTLQIQKGELFSLLGVNGAGKTTTIKMLTGLTQPTAGDAWLLGKSITKDPEANKGIIGISPQDTAVAPNLTVEENLAFLCGIYGYDQKKQAEKIQALTVQFQLQEVLKRRAGKLSGGWQRRLSIALALVGEPQILFLDEPTLGLDVLARHQLWDIIVSLKGETTMVLTTHYMEEAETLSDRIGIMKDGRLIALGTAQELIQKADAQRLEEAFVKLVKGA